MNFAQDKEEKFIEEVSPASDYWQSVSSVSPISEINNFPFEQTPYNCTPARSKIIDEIDSSNVHVVDTSPVKSDTSSPPPAAELFADRGDKKDVLETFMEAIRSPPRKIRAQRVSLFDSFSATDGPITATPTSKAVYKEDIADTVEVPYTPHEPDSEEKIRIIAKYGTSPGGKLGRTGQKRARALSNIVCIATCLLVLIPLLTCPKIQTDINSGNLLHSTLQWEVMQSGHPARYAGIDRALLKYTSENEENTKQFIPFRNFINFFTRSSTAQYPERLSSQMIGWEDEEATISEITKMIPLLYEDLPEDDSTILMKVKRTFLNVQANLKIRVRNLLQRTDAFLESKNDLTQLLII